MAELSEKFIPTPPKGYKWAANSFLNNKGYMTTTAPTLTGPDGTYRMATKKFSACCGIGHAVYFNAPGRPNPEALNVLFEGIERLNVSCSRVVTMLSLTQREGLTEQTLATERVLVKRGYKPLMSFKNLLWYTDDPNNKVTVWARDCADYWKEQRGRGSW